MIYPILLIVFFIVMLLYFKIADKYNIIDHPNERSSHSIITIRGGGIIFLLAAVVLLVLDFKELYLPLTGLILIGIISFLDDIYTLPNKLRFLVHLISASLLLQYAGIFTTYSLIAIVGFYFVVVGIINAYNFMDGINGITGLYSLIVLAGLQYINLKQISFIQPDTIWYPMLGCVVFLFFNFRTRAKCFAGDVGSVTIAFWIVTLLLKLILLTQNWVYMLFLVVYGVDTAITIIYRLILKQNIFKAHRLHFYQFLANEYKVPHLKVALLYAGIQAVIIFFVITNTVLQPSLLFGVVILPLVFVYFIARYNTMVKIKNNKY